MASTTKIEYFEVHKWYQNLRSSDKRGDHTASILKRIDTSENGLELRALNEVLHTEYLFQDRILDAIVLMEQEVRAHPTDSLMAITLAGDYLYHLEDAKTSLIKIETAWQKAKASGDFQRHALNTMARVALALDRYDLLEDCLWQIIQIDVRPHQMDVGRESDFFDNADKSRLPDELILRFQDYLKKGDASPID
jgi:hypothetical protein